MEKTERQKMSEISMSELVELEKTADVPLDNINIAPAAKPVNPANTNSLAKTDASAKVVVTDNKLEANMCVFSPQFSGKDITVADIGISAAYVNGFSECF